MSTLRKLLVGADKIAIQLGESEHGAEHMVLSALALPDNSAKKVFESIGADPELLSDAIKQQYTEAVKALGIDRETPTLRGVLSTKPITPKKLLADAKASAADLIQRIYKIHDKSTPLSSAHVLAAAATLEKGILPQAFSVLGIDQAQLLASAERELALGNRTF